MRVLVDVFAEDDRPPAGTPVVVQVRDTSLQDAPAVTKGEASAEVEEGDDLRIATIEVPVDDPGDMPTIWARVNVSGQPRVSRGDYVTVQSFRVPQTDAPRVKVVVKRV
jgi:hypothetical protein